METIDPGCTKPTTDYTYTDIVNLQTTMGNALTQVTAPYEEHRYSYLADTDDAFKNRSGGTAPPSFPKMPSKPDLADKISIRRTTMELKHYRVCTHISRIGIEVLEE